MELAVFFIIGVFATWRITWDITSCTPVQEEGKPDWCDYNQSGPFNFYHHLRQLFHRTFMPEWAVTGIECPYCVAVWAAGFIALLFPIYHGHSWFESMRTWLMLTLGMSGVVAFWFRRLALFFGIKASES